MRLTLLLYNQSCRLENFIFTICTACSHRSHELQATAVTQGKDAFVANKVMTRTAQTSPPSAASHPSHHHPHGVQATYDGPAQGLASYLQRHSRHHSHCFAVPALAVSFFLHHRGKQML